MESSTDGQGTGVGNASAEWDRLLLRRMAEGDAEALAGLYDRLAPTVLGFLVRLLRCRSLAEDILQETFFQAWRQAGAYRPETASPCSWLLAIARSRGIDCLRREAARKRRDEAYALRKPAVTAPVAVALMERTEWRRRLRAGLSRLSPEQRCCLSLAYEGDLSHSEISRRLGMPLGSVKSRVRLGMIKLGGLLEPDSSQGLEAGGAPSGGRSSAAVPPFLGRRILIVDHDPDFLMALGLVLQQLGAQVYEETSAPRALEALKSQRPDLLISDLRMSGMDGFALLEAVRALPESLGGRTPAIAISGAPAREVVPRMPSSGFQAFLPKPLNENDLLSAVPALVRR